MSMGQVVILNSERRRRALVRSWACMRLESAIRTAMAGLAAAGDEVIQKSSEWSGITGRFDLRGGSRGTQGNMSLYSRGAFKSGKRIAGLWKDLAELDWEWGSSGCFWWECCGARVLCAGSSCGSSSGCDFVNMQVYFCG